MAKTYLTVPYSQKEQAKALGARWDGAARQWFVPPGMELAGFQEWLPKISAAAPAAANPGDLLAPLSFSGELAAPVGVSLSELLAGVENAVSQAFQQGVWTRVEVVNVSVRNRHVYLELAERLQDGTVTAQARAAIWARTAERIIPEFERATGAQLAPGIKLLVLARPVFKAQYGFSLEITGIDASYTLGDLEAQKRRIREKLQGEDIFERNRLLPAPWDFSRVMVVAPPAAAGLGDFSAEANRLEQHGLCQFKYVLSRFQGPGAAAEILQSVQNELAKFARQPLDALIIIRGGGAVNDLAWLNDLELARFICLCEVPVLTGIGHERDRTILDEVAHRSFDTPSKVIAGIEKQIDQRARSAKEAYERIVAQALRESERSRIVAERLDSEIRATVRDTVSQAHRGCESAMNAVRLGSLGQVNEARAVSELHIRQVQDEARQHVKQGKLAVPTAMASVRELSAAAVRAARADVHALLPAVLDQAATQADRAQQDIRSARNVLLERAGQTVRTAKNAAEGLMREVAGQGPKRTLERGFAVVKAGGAKAVTSAKAASAAGSVELTFRDGTVQARVGAKSAKQSSGESDEQ